MKQNHDLNDVICGMAQLGEIYLRINGRLRDFYEKNPCLRYEAGQLMMAAGYEMPPFHLRDLIDTLLKGAVSVPVKQEDKSFLYRYAEMFNDPVLTQEVTSAFAKADEESRKKMITCLKSQLFIFPDDYLGFSDLYVFGYRKTDLFPVRKRIASEIFMSGKLMVYAVYEDGRTEPVLYEEKILSHKGMFGVKRDEWIEYCLVAFRNGETVCFTLTEPEKEYRIYQWKEDLFQRRDYSFMPYDALVSKGVTVDETVYDLVYEGRVKSSATLDNLFEMFNIGRPDDFTGHSLSVGDVIAIKKDAVWEAYYVDSIGFKKLEGYFVARPKMGLIEEMKERTLPHPEMREEERTPENDIEEKAKTKRIR